MEFTIESKHCLDCNRPITKGRTDKRFCSDKCRTRYNNWVKIGEKEAIRPIANILLKNRRILVKLLDGENEIRVDKLRLHRKGFDFRYFTHTYKNKKGDLYTFCYDHAYVLMEDDQVGIVKHQRDLTSDKYLGIYQKKV